MWKRNVFKEFVARNRIAIYIIKFNYYLFISLSDSVWPFSRGNTDVSKNFMEAHSKGELA
jgi:hypothetical protein